MKPAVQNNQLSAVAATSSDIDVLEAADALAQSIKASVEWRELVNAQKAARTDGRFARMVARQSELAQIQKNAQGHGQALDGNSLVEFVALREQIQPHELSVRQQEAWSALVALLQRINEKLSQQLGFDFASNAAPRGGGCCG
jgi:cell fate (sporulation/competence/biofilm development) regulator YlbF (YheA/YmcA/DUF963 family)